ncbi:MAG: helix-turn-helix domain-containing protein [Chlamydiales bacterium]|nr:helix-turn-helix domain-containing protein [Chlamydiales bacterium]
MSVEVKEIGKKFKQRRIELNLSLKEIENSTSIRSGYLEAIEEGSTDKFLTEVYMIGFMKQYGSFLGLNMEQVIKEYPHVFEAKGDKHHFEYGIGTLEVRGSVGGGVKWLPNLMWAGVCAAILVLTWFFAKYLNLI